MHYMQMYARGHNAAIYTVSKKVAMFACRYNNNYSDRHITK